MKHLLMMAFALVGSPALGATDSTYIARWGASVSLQAPPGFVYTGVHTPPPSSQPEAPYEGVPDTCGHCSSGESFGGATGSSNAADNGPGANGSMGSDSSDAGDAGDAGDGDSSGGNDPGSGDSAGGEP